MIAIGTHDIDALIDVIVEMTSPPPETDMRELRADIEAWVNRYLLVGVGELDMTAIIDSGMDLLHRHKLVLPADLALLFRVLLRLQGLGRGVGMEVRVTELLQPYLASMMADRFSPKRFARAFTHSARGWEHLVARIPEDAEALFEQLRTGTLGVDFRIRDPDHAVDHLVDGLVTGAAVLGGRAAHGSPGRSDDRWRLDSRPRRRRCRRRHVASSHRAPRNVAILGHARTQPRGSDARLTRK